VWGDRAVADPQGPGRQGPRPTGVTAAGWPGCTGPESWSPSGSRPSKKQAVRDLCRARADMVQDRTRARHRLSKLLPRHGRPWRGGNAWTLTHERWLLAQRFEQPALAATYAHYRAVLAARDAALPVTVMTALVDHLDRHAQPGPDGLLFSTATGSYLQRGNFSRQVWQPAVARAGLGGLRFHDLRHTAATLAAATGPPPGS
jgi:hypothetical protein